MIVAARQSAEVLGVARVAGRRRLRAPFFIDGRRESRARRWPVAVLNDALAAAAASVLV